MRGRMVESRLSQLTEYHFLAQGQHPDNRCGWRTLTEQNSYSAQSSNNTVRAGEIEPQEVKFSQPMTAYVDIDGEVKNLPHYLIFDDQPEHIRRCDLLDDGEMTEDNKALYDPHALMHVEGLGPAV